MATFVRVHGAWHGGWCWKRVRPLRSHLASPEVELETHMTDVDKSGDLADVLYRAV